MRPLRIALVVEQLAIGGLERMTVDLALAEKAAGHLPVIYCVFSPGELAAEAEAAGVRVIPFHKKLGFSFKTLLRMARQLRRDRIDVVHTHNSVIHHYGAVAAALARVPVVVNTQHGIGSFTIRRRQARLFRSVLPLTGAVVFVSNETRRFIWEERRYPPDRARVIVNGVRLDRFLGCPATPGAALPRLRFGTVGRMAAVKDHATLLRAFAVVAPRLPDAELRLLGDGALAADTRRLAASLGIEHRVTFYPGMEPVPLFLANLDVFVLSSETEGLPLCILEAMAAGLPIVSTRVGGVPEAAPEGQVAWYCPPKDPEQLAEALLEAARSPDLASRGQEAQRIVSARFSIDVMSQRYLSLFEELLTKKNR